jgi:hypothetical protein
MDATADTLDVQSSGGSNGKLIVSGPITLTLHNQQHNTGNATDESNVDGVILLSSTPSGHPTISFASADHAFVGSGIGRVDGDNVSDVLFVGHGLTFTNRITIQGSLTIKSSFTPSPSSGTFFNSGTVLSHQEIDIGSPLVVQDGSGAAWKASDCGGRLVFLSAATLVGDFSGDPAGGGTFEFYNPVYTCGTWTRNGSGVTIYGTAAFDYRTFVQGSIQLCGNPTSTTQNDGCGGNSYHLTSSADLCWDGCGG